MSKPESYPFLRIAREYRMDYSRVLQMADWFREGKLARTHQADTLGLADPIWRDIATATAIQQAVRDGYIDWQTGERIK